MGFPATSGKGLKTQLAWDLNENMNQKTISCTAKNWQWHDKHWNKYGNTCFNGVISMYRHRHWHWTSQYPQRIVLGISGNWYYS